MKQGLALTQQGEMIGKMVFSSASKLFKRARLPAFFYYSLPGYAFLSIIICLISNSQDSKFDNSLQDYIGAPGRYDFLQNNQTFIRNYDRFVELPPIQDIKIQQQCEDGYEQLTIQLDQTTSCCIISDSGTEFDMKIYRNCISTSTTCTDSPLSINYFGDTSSICILRYSPDTYSFVKHKQNCNSSFNKCGMQWCVKDSLECPISSISFSNKTTSTPTISSRLIKQRISTNNVQALLSITIGTDIYPSESEQDYYSIAYTKNENDFIQGITGKNISNSSASSGNQVNYYLLQMREIQLSTTAKCQELYSQYNFTEQLFLAETSAFNIQETWLRTETFAVSMNLIFCMLYLIVFSIISCNRKHVRLMFELSWHLLMSMFSLVFSTAIIYQVLYIEDDFIINNILQQNLDNNCIQATYFLQFAKDTQNNSTAIIDNFKKRNDGRTVLLFLGILGLCIQMSFVVWVSRYVAKSLEIDDEVEADIHKEN